MSNPIPVVCGIVWTVTGKIIISRRGFDQPLPGMWQFPGGKVEAGETLGAALHRELYEELNLGEITIIGLAHHQVVQLEHGDFELYYVHCSTMFGRPEPRMETIDCKEVTVDELGLYLNTPGDKLVATYLQKIGHEIVAKGLWKFGSRLRKYNEQKQEAKN